MTDAASAAAAAAIRTAREAPGGRPETVSEPTNALTADFETFLRLLTTQMQNQDPLQPMESTEFVSQLAQFSAVEQQVATNDQLGQILDSLSGGASQLAEWLGRSVRSAAPARFEGETVAVYPGAATLEASSATLVVSDSEGATVAEIPFEPGAERVDWAGETAAGGTAPEGVYGFAVRYGAADGTTETVPAETYGAVVEARRGDAGVELSLAGGAVVPVDEVTGVR